MPVRRTSELYAQPTVAESTTDGLWIRQGRKLGGTLLHPKIENASRVLSTRSQTDGSNGKPTFHFHFTSKSKPGRKIASLIPYCDRRPDPPRVSI